MPMSSKNADRRFKRGADRNMEAYEMWRAQTDQAVVHPAQPAQQPSVPAVALPSMHGTVKWLNTLRGYGFIKPADGGQDVFFHVSALKPLGLTELSEGQRLAYELTLSRDNRLVSRVLQLRFA